MARGRFSPELRRSTLDTVAAKGLYSILLYRSPPVDQPDGVLLCSRLHRERDHVNHVRVSVIQTMANRQEKISYRCGRPRCYTVALLSSLRQHQLDLGASMDRTANLSLARDTHATSCFALAHRLHMHASICRRGAGPKPKPTCRSNEACTLTTLHKKTPAMCPAMIEIKHLGAGLRPPAQTSAHCLRLLASSMSHICGHLLKCKPCI